MVGGDDGGGARAAARRPAAAYGAYGTPNADGVAVPDGFTARRVARGTERVPGTGYDWHKASDGSATFPTEDGGWILVSNSEEQRGGAGAMRFGRRRADRATPTGSWTAPRRTAPGGPTPWATWLSCEEYEEGRVWECDPTGRAQGARARRDGRVQARGRGGGPARAPRVHDRGPDRRCVLPLHAPAVAVADRGPAGDGQGRRAAARWSGSTCPTGWRARSRSGARSRASPSSGAPRASGSTAAPSTCRPPPTRASTPTTLAASGCRSSTTAWPRAMRR